MGKDHLDSHVERYREFATLWGQMASSWGVKKTFAQIHALLYSSGKAMDTDEIMEILEISRGSANMNLRSLADWGLVTLTNKPGSRKDYYQADGNIWDVTVKIINERSKRDVLPLIRDLGSFAEKEELDSLFKERVLSMVNIVELFQSFTDAIIPSIQGEEEELQKVIEVVEEIQV